MLINLEIQNAIDAQNIPTESQVNDWIKATLKGAEYPFETIDLTIRIVSRDESQQLNHDYRAKNSPTNVLSFPFEPPEMIPASEFEGLLGDLAICHDLVIEEAQQQNKKVENHWAHLIIHGVLHLLGYDHIDQTEAEAMEKLEVEILAQFKIADPYFDQV